MTDDTPPTPAELFNATAGGECGITFFANGVRVFVPENATKDDKLAAAHFLLMLASAE